MAQLSNYTFYWTFRFESEILENAAKSISYLIYENLWTYQHFVDGNLNNIYVY